MLTLKSKALLYLIIKREKNSAIMKKFKVFFPPKVFCKGDVAVAPVIWYHVIVSGYK